MTKSINYLYMYSTTEIYWIGEWCKDRIKVTESISNKLQDIGKEIFKMTGKLPDDTNNFATNTVYVYFTLNELKEIRNYASIYHYSSNTIPVKAATTLKLINSKINYLEGEEKMKNKSELENNVCDERGLANLQPFTLAERISCKCDYISCNIHNNEKELTYIIKKCIEHEYNVEYKVEDGVVFKGYITHGELISCVETDETKFYITIHTPADEGDLVIDMLSEINLKYIKFENNTLYIQKYNKS